MSGAGEAGQIRSLSDLVCALRPGGPCPWCGAELQCTAAPLAGSNAGRTQPSPECGADSLVCPDCGAEVHDSLCEGLCVGVGDLGAAA